MSESVGLKPYPCAERVHRAFRGSTELAKSLRFAASAAEVISVFIAGLRILMPGMSWSGWASFALAFVVISGVALHMWARAVISFSEKCRRVAIRAYGFGRDVPRAVETLLASDTPILADRFASKLPTQSLDDYYESKKPAGLGRVRELYSHSAFYSWRLRRVCWRIYLISAVVFAMLGLMVIYALASEPSDATISGRILDLVCSIIFVFLVTRSSVAAIEVKQSFVECRRIMESLLGQDANSDPNELTVEYDIEMSRGITIPTFLYKRMRDDLKKEWDHVSEELK